MPRKDRNSFADGPWVLKRIDHQALCDSFDCGDPDLNDYFHEDAAIHRQELLSQSYYLHERSSPGVVVALMDFCNDAVQLKSYRQALQKYKDLIPIDERKKYPYLPAVKVTRFGVQKALQGQNLGSHALNMVKRFFTTDNRTGCRFITVDAYNEERVIRFYKKNGFQLLTEGDKAKPNRSMFFDLKRLMIPQEANLRMSSAYHT